MRIPAETVAKIETAMLQAQSDAKLTVLNVRQAWDVFHVAWTRGLINGNELYREFNDSHLETAFRKIYKL